MTHPPLETVSKDESRVEVPNPETCDHKRLGEGPQPARFSCRCGTIVYRSYEDYCWD